MTSERDPVLLAAAKTFNECREYRATSVTCQKCAESLCGSCMVEHKCEKEQPK